MVPLRETDHTEIRESLSIATFHMVVCAIERLGHPSFMKVVFLHWCCLKRVNKDQQADGRIKMGKYFMIPLSFLFHEAFMNDRTFVAPVHSQSCGGEE